MQDIVLSSSPVSFQDPDDLTLDLQPAPLRLPRRRTDPDLDGTNSLKEEHTSMVGDDNSTPTVRRKSPSPPPRRAIARPLSQRRAPAPKLGSLVSKFEVLDSVNNVDADLSPIPMPTSTSRIQRPLRHSRASESLQSIASDKYWTTANSLNMPPRRVDSPPLHSDNSIPLIKTISKKPSTEDIIETDRRRVFEHESSTGKAKSIEHSPVTNSSSSVLSQTATQKILPTPTAISSPPLPISSSPQKHSLAKSTMQNVPTDSPPKHSQKGNGQTYNNTEQAVRGIHGPPASSKSPVKRTQMSVADLRKSFEKNSPVTGREQQVLDKPKLSSDTPPYRAAQVGREVTHSFNSGNGRGIPSIRTPTEKDSTATQPLSSRKLTKPRSENILSEHAIASRQPESTRLRRIDNRNLDGAVSLEGEDASNVENGPTELNMTTVSDAQPILENKSSRTSKIHSILTNNSKASFHGMMTIINTSSTSLDTRTGPANKIKVPELTTEILDGARLIKSKARAETNTIESQSFKQESPVRSRIQQFESLESGPLDNVTTPCSYGVDSNISPNKRKTNTGRAQPQTSSRPSKKQKAGLWRRISNTITRSIDEGNSNSNNGERSDVSQENGINNDRSNSICRRPRHRRSNLFGYHLYRASEVIRSSTDSVYTRSHININEELIERFENQPPYIGYRRSPSSYQSMRRTFPFLARMSDDLGCSDEFDSFGFDGSVLSKAIRRRDKSSFGQASQAPSSPMSCSDSNPVSSTTSKATTSGRKRRRLEVKELRKEQRRKDRERAKGKGKEKEKAMSNNHKVENAQDKGGGKEVEGKKKESSWSKKTASGFMVRQIHDIKLKHPKPRRPGQIKKIVNMYKDKSTSGIRLGKGSGISSGSGTAGTSGAIS
ncbi:hypothetical protein F4811DRAFT_569657 [Daldinia bambusicola]|nr:hypothetical protein F4811DRAFT_569657 [Daldinia bambusicola]